MPHVWFRYRGNQTSPSSYVGSWVLGVAAVVLSGCGSSRIGFAPATQGSGLTGSAYGGQQPITGATIQLYAVGTTGDGSAATPLLASPAISAAGGYFSVGAYTCPSPSSLVYLTATGGNPGFTTSVDNAQLALMVVMGPCDTLSAATFVTVNEQTTVGTVAALAPFMNSRSAIGSESLDSQLLTDAFTLAKQLADPETGQSPGANIPTGLSVQSTKLATLANILSICINSTGGQAGDGSVCGALLSLATPQGGAAPTDTIGFLINLANAPAQNVPQIYGYGPANGPFQPTLSVTPPDWSLPLLSPTPTPSMDPRSGTYLGATSVSLASVPPVDSIHYTLDGSTPTAASAIYTGPVTLTATSLVRAVALNGAVPSVMIAGKFTILPAQKLVFLSQPAPTLYGAALDPAPTIAIEDARGNVNTSSQVPVTLQLGADPGKGALSGTLTVNAINGIVSFPDLSVSAPTAAYTLTATSPGFAAASSLAFTVRGAAFSMTLPNPTINVGSTLAGQLTLSAPTTTALSVALASSSPSNVKLIQQVVVIPAGQSGVRFQFQGIAPGVSTLAAAAVGYSQASATITVVPVVPPSTLRQAAAQRGFLMGAVADADEFGYFNPLTGSAQYAATLGSEYNMIEGENAMKWIVTEPSQGVYNFEPGDQITTFAQSHQMKVRGHTLAWWTFNPDWLNTLAKTATPAKMSQLLHNHISAEMQHYKGKVFAWDVVNEAVSDSATGTGTQLRDQIWYNQPGIGLTGTGWIEQAFRWAREADPDALLFYNEYNIYTPGGKTQAVINMIADFKKRGVPIDGVGLQMHTDTHGWPNSTDLATTIKAFTDLGVQVHITESDVQVPVNVTTTAGTATPAWLQLQAQTYQRLLTVCLQNPGCTAFQTWGFTDNYSWIPAANKGFGAALPFDQNYQPKPAFTGLMNALRAVSPQ